MSRLILVFSDDGWSSCLTCVPCVTYVTLGYYVCRISCLGNKGCIVIQYVMEMKAALLFNEVSSVILFCIESAYEMKVQVIY